MPFDPSLPQENTLIDAAQMRAQLNALNDAIAACAANPAAVEPLTFEPSDPPSVGDIWALYGKINELLLAIKRP
jgi:hypothetical protein